MEKPKLKELELRFPEVEFETFGNQARSTGMTPFNWAIYAEKINEDVSEVYVKVQTDDPKSIDQIAHVTVHRNRNPSLMDETKLVAAAILKDAVRSWTIKKYDQKREQKNKLRKLWFRSNKEN